MTLKKPHTITKFDLREAPRLDENIRQLYGVKVESRFRNNSGSITIAPYQSLEHGELNFSATGSPTVSITVAFAESKGSVVYVNAHSTNTLFSTHITDVTNSEITITMRSISGTADFSDVSTGLIKTFYQIVGSSP